MPLYEYKCLNCETTFEALQKLDEKPLNKCPKCGGKLKKLISAPSIQFKGSGWYVTDYSKKGTVEKASKEKKVKEKEHTRTTEKQNAPTVK